MGPRGEVFCEMGGYPQFFMYNDTDLEAKSDDNRMEIRKAFSKLFPYDVKGEVRLNADYEDVYVLYYYENERLLVRIFKYEAYRMLAIKAQAADSSAYSHA
jgi:hypothetical protein